MWKEAYSDPQRFWDEKAKQAENDIFWFKKWDKVFEWNYPRFEWFKGGKTNVCYNCLDYKVERYGNKLAYIYESPELGLRYAVT